MAAKTYPLIRSETSSRLVLDRSSGRLPAKGCYGYQWIVTDETGSRRVLSGITTALASRLSAYISQFNRDLTARSSELHELVRDPKNKTIVQVFKYDENTNLVEAEEELIASVPKEENLNKTKGGNGGGSWDQYGDRSPSVKAFPQETPVKYYPFARREKGNVAPLFTPGVKAVKDAVYVIKHKSKGTRYIGTSSDLPRRMRSHGSKATHDPVSKVAKALAQSPDSHVFGVLPSSQKYTPLSRRAAEKHYIEEQQPAYNTNAGGGGSAPMPKRLKFGRGDVSDSSAPKSNSAPDAPLILKRKAKRVLDEIVG